MRKTAKAEREAATFHRATAEQNDRLAAEAEAIAAQFEAAANLLKETKPQ